MLPIKIVKDVNPSAAPANSSNLNVNINFDILKNALVNEQGFDKLDTNGINIIGSCILPDNSVCIFSVVQYATYTESQIGVIDNFSYKLICRDQLGVVNLGFTTEHQIKAESKVNFNGDYVIYWVDGFNPDRWLNITNPQIALSANRVITNEAQLQLMSGFTPRKGEYIDQTATVITGGSLVAAVYYIIVTYGDKYKNFTKPLYVSSPLPVVESNGNFGIAYVGSKAGAITDKALQFSIDAARLNIEYEYLKINVIKKENQALTGYEFGIFPFGTTDFNCIIDSLTNVVTPESILINFADYRSSLAITQLDDVLYKAHLKTRNRFNFQPYVNNITTNYVQKQIDLSLVTAGNNFRDPNMCFYSKGFMYDETYALYASFIVEEEGFEYETDAYHIPGRRAAGYVLGGSSTPVYESDKITDVIVNPLNYTSTYYVNGTLSDRTPLSQLKQVSDQAKVFHAVKTNDNPSAISLYGSNMGYWENESEVYFDNQSWVVKDATGAQTANYQGNKVRHHKFPEAYNSTTSAKSIHPSSTNYNIVNILGVQLSNIVIPNEYYDKVKNIKLYYAKRDFNNRTILGQSLLETLMGLHAPGPIGDYDTENKIFNSVGNIIHTDMRSPGGSGTNGFTGMFPLGYDRYAAQNVSPSWSSVDQGGPNEYPTDDVSGYFKIKPFDMMQQVLTPGTATYMKNVYRISGRYDALLDDGVDLSDYNKTYKVNYIFDPTGTHTYPAVAGPSGAPNYIYNGINRNITGSGTSNPLSNQYRKIVNAEYVNLNTPPTQDASFQSSPYSFTMLPFNYQGEKAVWVQTGQKLYPVADPAPTYETSIGNPLSVASFPDGDFARFMYYTNTQIQTCRVGGAIGINTTYAAYVAPYISNICAFKLNLFNRFDNQVLCEAGVVPVGPATIDFYGGDTFTSYYGERNTFNLKEYTPGGAGKPDSFLDTIHCYITQSTSNINYRYVGPNNWETFYPRTDWDGMNSLPIGINEEWYGYSADYSAVNDLLQPVIQSNNINQVQTLFPNRVIRSATNNPETMDDNYLIYEANNYDDFGKAKGPIENITNQNSKLIIKTRNALYYTLGREVINTQNAESYVGAGDIFAVKPKESVTSDSYGGGIGRFSDVVTQYGYMYTDTTNGIVYVAAPASATKGDSINEISNEGLQIFFRSELKFKLPNQLYDKYYSLLPTYNIGTTYVADWYVKYNNDIWKSNTAIPTSTYPGISDKWDKVDFYNLTDNTTDIQGIGTIATFDYKYRRYILSKKDYNFVEFSTEFLGNIPLVPSVPPEANYGKIVYYNGILYSLCSYTTDNKVYLPRGFFGLKIDFADHFEDKSFTIAYYPEAKAWVSMYNYYPEFLAHTVDKVYSSKNNSIYKHNSDDQNNFYYDDTVIESFVEPILNSPAGVKKYGSLSFFTDVMTKNFGNLQKLSLDYLESFTSYFVRNTWQMSKPVDMENTVTSRNSERYFITNDFRDFTKDNKDALMTNDYIPAQNTANLNLTKHWSLQKKFVDYFLIPRLIFKNKTTTVDLGANVITLGLIDTANNIYKFYSPNYTFALGDMISFIDYDNNPHIVLITEILAGNNYRFKNFVYGMTDDVNETTFSIFETIANKQIYIYDIDSTQTKNIR